jgi:ABC-type transport system involved in cytochrome c biogenesis ATPase subunit
MLAEVTIRRFKTIEQITLPLERINLLIGANNSGKSSVLQAIQFAVSVAQTMKEQGAEWRGGKMELSFPPDRLVYSPFRDIAALRFNRSFSEGNAGIEIVFVGMTQMPPQAPAQPAQQQPSQPSADPTVESQPGNSVPAPPKTTVQVNKGRGQNIKCIITGIDLGRLFTPMNQPYSIFVPGLAGIPTWEEFKSEVLVRKAAARGDANNVFRNVLWLLRQNQIQWQKFSADFRKVFPEQTLEVTFKADRDEQISCEVVKSWLRLPVDAAGTGVLQAIQILAYISLYRPKLLILDEPDAHLHPNNQRRLIRLVGELAVEGDFQVILSSHSRHLLDELEGTARKHWIRKGSRVDDSEYESIAALFDIGALDRGDLLRAGKVKCVVLSEDQDSQCIRELLKAAGIDVEDVEIWPYRGCSNQDTAVALAQVVSQHAPKTAVLVHRDRDYMSDDEVKVYRESIETRCPNSSVFVTDGTDAESHFLSLDHLASLLPSLPRPQVEAIVQRATDDMADESLKTYINSRLQIESQRLRREGKQVNIGEFSVSCAKAFEANPVSLRHGKKVLKRLRHILQSELKVQQNPIQSSAHISHPDLVGLATKILSVTATSAPTN